VLLDDRYQYFPETADIRSFLGIPVIANDRTIGMITLDSYQTARYTEQDAELGLVLAGHASIAIENARLFDVEQRRRKQAEILREATAALTTTIELDKLFEIIFDSLAKLVPYDSSAIEMINRGDFEIVAGRGIPNGLLGKKYPADLEKWGGVDRLRRPLIIPDVRMDDRYEKLEGLEYIVGWMGIHLFAQGKLIGCLNLDSKTPAFFNEEHAAIAQTFANQVAISIENARLFREESRRSQIIETLADIANEIATTQEEISALDRIAERALFLLNASSVAVYLLQDDNKTIKIVSARGDYQEELISHTINVGQGITGNIIANGKPEIINDIAKDPRRITVPGTPKEDALLDTMMSAPLILHGESIGAMNAWRLRSNGLFDVSELNFLVSIAHQASILIESVRLFDEITRRAQEAAAIAEVGRNISATLDLNIVLERIATYAKDLLRTGTSAVYLAEADSHILQAVSAIGIEAEEIKNDPLEIGAGILGNIALQQYGEIVNDTAADPRSIIIKGTESIPDENIMGVPVLLKGQLTGLLAVWRRGVDKKFKATELEFLGSLAQQAAVAIENARLFEEEQKRRQEAENLQVAATVITSSLDPQEVLETILVALKQVVPYDSASIFLIEGEQARITAAKGLPNMELVINKTFPASNALSAAIVETLQPMILEDAQEDERFENWTATESIHGWMGIPLIARGKAIGYITLDNHTPGAFNEHSAFLAQTFAHQASAAIENARLYAETRRRLEEQEVISHISVSLRVAKNSQEMLHLILDQVLRVMDTSTASICLYVPDRDELVSGVAKGWLSQLPKQVFKPGEGIVGHVFSSGELHVSRKYAIDPLVHSENTTAFGKDWGGVTLPIRTTTDVIGVLSVALPTSRPIEQHHIQLLTTIAEIAGNAIQRVSLFEHSETQVQRLTALREIDTAIASSFNLKVTLDILANHTMTLLGVSAVDFLIYDADQQMLNYFTGTGLRSSAVKPISFRIGEGLAGKAMLERRVIFVEDLSVEKTYLKRSSFAQDEFISYCAVPLISKGIMQGILEVFFREVFKPNEDWHEFLRILAGQATIAIDNAHLFENLQRSNQDLSLAYDTTLEGWGKALELKDKETHGHTRRVTDMTVKLARIMEVPEAKIVPIRRGVLLHDIGKMGISDTILRKKGPLTKKEWQEMWKHPQYAYDLLSSIPYLQPALEIPYSHHERWDGSGYPRGLKGNDIPLSARIFAVVDVWDALISERSYKGVWSRQKAIKYLKEQSGAQFDPEVVRVFLDMIKKEAK
jgi:GAF domain-containing protein